MSNPLPKTREELAELIRDVVREALQNQAAAADPPTYVDAAAIVKRYGISRATLHTWVHDQGCPHLMRGNVLRFELAAVEDWFRGRPAKLKRVK